MKRLLMLLISAFIISTARGVRVSKAPSKNLIENLHADAAALAPTIVIDLVSSTPSPPVLLAVQVCAGLFNRNGTNSVYTLMHTEDVYWLNTLFASPPQPTPIADFMTTCFLNNISWIRYNFTSQQALVPNLITLAAMLDAIPLEDDSPYIPPSSLPLSDVTVSWAGLTAINVTLLLFNSYAKSTSTMSKMNPGYDVHTNPISPSLTGLPDLSLTDYIVSQRLFNFWLPLGCIPFTDENNLLGYMASPNNTNWPQPISVFGYDDSFAIGGDLFEAETTCFPARNAGQIATVGVNNLAFFSRAAPAQQFISPPSQTIYNSSKTYVALIVGDGDNIAYLKGSRATWMDERTSRCSNKTSFCFPLLWSLSPHISNLAPQLLDWFFAQATLTGADAFVLPPSGHLYAYPSQMSDIDQLNFVSATETDAILYNTSGSVEWEFFGTWANAISKYMPLYTARNIVKSLFAVNVPYMLPIVDFAFNETFKIINKTLVLFKPQEWRGTSGAADPNLQPFLINASQMASRLSSLPLGSVTHIYLTSDGGGELKDFFDMVELLEEHVAIVGLEVGDLAVAAAAATAAAAVDTE